jgi:hypothetical protein
LRAVAVRDDEVAVHCNLGESLHRHGNVALLHIGAQRLASVQQGVPAECGYHERPHSMRGSVHTVATARSRLAF